MADVDLTAFSSLEEPSWSKLLACRLVYIIVTLTKQREQQQQQQQHQVVTVVVTSKWMTEKAHLVEGQRFGFKCPSAMFGSRRCLAYAAILDKVVADFTDLTLTVVTPYFAPVFSFLLSQKQNTWGKQLGCFWWAALRPPVNSGRAIGRLTFSIPTRANTFKYFHYLGYVSEENIVAYFLLHCIYLITIVP